MFEQLTLKQKLIGLELLAFVMLVAMAVFGIFQLGAAVQDEKDVIARLNADMRAMASIDELNVATLKEAKLAKDVWIRGNDPATVSKYRGEFTDQVKAFEKNHAAALDEIKKLAAGHPDFDVFVQRLEALPEEHRVMSEKYLAQIDAHSGDVNESDAKVKGIDRALSKQIKELRDSFVVFIEEKGAEKITQAEQELTQRRTVLLIGVGVFLALSILLASLILRQIFGQLGGDPRDVAQVVNVMAAGDFSSRPHAQLPEGSLLSNAYKLQASLRDVLANVKAEADEVGQMAHSLASAAKQIAENAHHEADSVSTMAAAIEEMSVSTTQISERGDGARKIANSSRTAAAEGAQVVNKTVSGLLVTAREIEVAAGEVSHLGENASHINDVVKVIKEIADQTNLLALNAAIEAARAGEQGRGFAVVADEVRKLAERTGNATTEINQMSTKIGEVANHALGGMDTVVATTRQGVTDAESAQNSIAAIEQTFNDVSTVIEEISAALSEQTVAAAELAKNTERVSQMSEENSQAANSLLTMATRLENGAGQVHRIVAGFKV